MPDAEPDGAPTREQVVSPRDDRSNVGEVRGCEAEDDKEKTKKKWKRVSQKNKEKAEKKHVEKGEDEKFWEDIAEEFGYRKDDVDEKKDGEEFICSPCDDGDLSQGVATEEGEEGRKSKGLMSPMRVTKEERE